MNVRASHEPPSGAAEDNDGTVTAPTPANPEVPDPETEPTASGTGDGSYYEPL